VDDDVRRWISGGIYGLSYGFGIYGRLFIAGHRGGGGGA
jgi:hypothetical protein